MRLCSVKDNVCCLYTPSAIRHLKGSLHSQTASTCRSLWHSSFQWQHSILGQFSFLLVGVTPQLPGGRHISAVLVGATSQLSWWATVAAWTAWPSKAVKAVNWASASVFMSDSPRPASPAVIHRLCSCLSGCHPQTLLLPPRVSRPPTVIARWLPGPPSSHSCIKSLVGIWGKERYWEERYWGMFHITYVVGCPRHRGFG